MPIFWSDLTKAADTGYAVSFFVNKELLKTRFATKTAKTKSKLLLYYQEITLKSKKMYFQEIWGGGNEAEQNH